LTTRALTSVTLEGELLVFGDGLQDNSTNWSNSSNRTLTEAARTMLTDLLLPIPFWAEAVNTACYVQNRVLVTKPHNKTPYALLHGRTPSIGFIRPFGCPVTILNTLDSLGKFDGKVDEGFLNNDGDADFDEKEPKFDAKKPKSEVNVSPSSSAQSKKQDDKTKREDKGKSPAESFIGYRYLSAEFEDYSEDSINEVNAAGTLVPAVRQISPNNTNTFSAAELEDITCSDDEDDVGAEADFNNLETSITVSPIPTTRVHKDHHVTQIIGDLSLTTWVLVDLPYGKRAIGTKWVFRNKKDEKGIVARNKARLVTQGHTQEEGIDYEEVFAPVARIEAIRLLLAYASFMGFMVYQMNVKIAFLYGTIEEEVYVCQPLGFEDPDHSDKVYKVVKALYGLHQALRAWYETLENYLLENGFQRGKINQTLFIKRQKGDILLVQVYVKDIIFGATNKDLCKSFEKLMKDKFQMSLMEELTFFLGLQVKQKKDGIFISQDKYVAEILRKFGLTDTKLAKLLEYMVVHVNDASKSSKPSWGKMCTLKKFVADFLHVPLNGYSPRPNVMYNIEAILVDHYPGGRKVHFLVLIDSGATVSTSLKRGKLCTL
nr:retrovirus-related Pol polyprotein from transposon TNT 1-94 [Tanacetum cinerariifolium]